MCTKNPEYLDIFTCIGCGCDDEHACINENKTPCHWLKFDVRKKIGVCSECAECLDIFEIIKDAKACPYCGSSRLRSTRFSGDEGEYDGIECMDCDASNSLAWWNKRSGAGAPLPSSIQEALNSGDGVYRP